MDIVSYMWKQETSYMWLIPKDAKKPVDARRKEFKHE
jgi:hypothetical protein